MLAPPLPSPVMGPGGGCVLDIFLLCALVGVVCVVCRRPRPAPRHRITTRQRLRARHGCRRLLRLVCMCALAGAVFAAPSPTVGGGEQAAAPTYAAGIDFASAEARQAAAAELAELKQGPFRPHQLAEQFAHGLDAFLPHGTKWVPEGDE